MKAVNLVVAMVATCWIGGSLGSAETRQFEARGEVSRVANYVAAAAHVRWTRLYLHERVLYAGNKKPVWADTERSVKVDLRGSKDSKKFRIAVREWNPMDGLGTPFFKIDFVESEGVVLVKSSSNRDKLYDSNRMHEELALWIEEWNARAVGRDRELPGESPTQ